MRHYGLTYTLVIVGGLVVIAGGLALLFSNFIDLRATSAPAVQSQPIAAVKRRKRRKWGWYITHPSQRMRQKTSTRR